jgi:transcriptional regulator with XRE-family HTH domain
MQRHLIAARLAAGLTQRELAEKFGKHQSHVSKVESGVRRLDVVEFIAWIRALELDPVALFAVLATEFDARPNRSRYGQKKPVR